MRDKTLRVKLALGNRARAAMLIGGWWLLIAALIAWSTLAFRADRLENANASAGLRKSLEKAISLEPLNAEHVHTRGRYALFVEQDADAAIASYKRAVELNPHVARYWLDLAGAYQVTGDKTRERAAVEKAVAAYPSNPDVLWEAANYAMLSGDTKQALQRFRAVIANDSELSDEAISMSWRAGGNVDAVLQDAVPPTADAHFQLLQLLVARGQPQDARRVWSHLTGLQQSFSAHQAFPYIQFLLDQHATGEAVQVWRQLPAFDSTLGHRSVPGNLVVNAGFDEPILGGGFDWRVEAIPAVQLAVDESTFHSAPRSLAITFMGPPFADAGIHQLVPVQPHTDYELSAFVRAQSIEGQSGPRLAITDVKGSPLAMTDDWLGTFDWRRQSVRVNSGDSDLLAIRVVRQPAAPLIKGRLWIDDVKLDDVKIDDAKVESK